MSQDSIWEARIILPHLGYVRNPLYLEWNFSLQKRFALPRAGMFLQGKGKATNASNSPQFAGADATLSHVPAFQPQVGETGFGTLPTSQEGNARSVAISMKLIF